jgi:DNA-binding response OmpR family regulator
MFTAFDNSKERALSYKAGADGFMNKPLNIRTLLQNLI